METKLPSGSFHLMNDEDVKLRHRTKLARCLWLGNDGMPRKEQSVVTWLTTILASESLSHDPDIDFAWQTLDEILRSKQLELFVSSQPLDIAIKSPFVKTYIEKIQSLEDFDDKVVILLQIGTTMMNNVRISSDMNKKFATFLQFAAAWITAIQKFGSLDNEMQNQVKMFVEIILLKVKDKFGRHNNPKKALSLFLEQLFTPSIQLLNKWLNDNVTTNRSMLTLLESILEELLFSRKNLDVFEKFFNDGWHTAAPESKPERVLDQFWTKFNENLNHEQVQLKWISVLYELLLKSFSKGSKNLKFRFYCKIVSCCSEKSMLQNDETLMALSHLLELNIQESLYQRTVDPESAKEQKNHYIDFIDKLLDDCTRPGPGWGKCICLVTKVDHHIADKKLNNIFSKILNHGEKNIDWLNEFFSGLVHIFTQIRKPVQMLKSYVQALKEHCGGEESAKVLIACDAFESALQSQCIAKCPHNTALDIWSEIQHCLKAMLITPEKHETPLPGTAKGRKHKISGSDETKAKRPKLTATNMLLPKLASLLCSVMEECNVLDIKEQVSMKHRMNELVMEQGEIFSQLIANIRFEYHESDLSSLLQLITTHKNLVQFLNRYSIHGATWADSTFQNLKALMDMCKNNVLSSTTELYYNRWLCSWVLLLRQQGFEDLNTEMDVVLTVNELTRKFLTSVSRNLSEGSLTLELSKVFKRNIHNLLCTPEAHETVADIFLSAVDAKQDGMEHKLENICSICEVPSFLECTSLHSAIIRKVVEKFSGIFKEGKGTPVLLDKLLHNSDAFTVDDITLVLQTIFSEKSPTKKRKKIVLRVEKMVKILKPITYLPAIPPDLQPCLLVTLLVVVSIMRSSGGYKRFPANVHNFIACNVDSLTVSNSKLLSVIPMKPLLNYLMQIYCCMETKSVVKRLMVSTVHVICRDEPLGKSLIGQIVTAKEEAASKELFSNIILCTVSTKILSQLEVLHLPVAENLFSVFHPTKIVSPDRINVVRAMFQNCKKVENKILKEKVDQLSIVLKEVLERHTAAKTSSSSSLLSKFALEKVAKSSGSTNKFLTENINLSAVDDVDSMKYALLFMEVKLHQKFKFESDDQSWFTTMRQLMNLYSVSFVKTSPISKLLVDRMILIHMQMGCMETHVKCLFAENLKSLQTQQIAATVSTQMPFIQFLSSLFDLKAKTFQTFSKSSEGEVNEEVHLIQVKYLRDTFDLSVGLFGDLLQSDEPEIDTQLHLLTTITSILNLGPTVVHSRLVSLVFHALARIQLSVADNRHRELFEATYRTLDAVVVHHETATINLVPQILSICSKLLNYALVVGRQSYTSNNQGAVETSIECTRMLDRLFQYIVTEYGAYFKRCVPYTIAEFVTGESKDTLHPNVKKTLQSAMYHLMSLCDDYSVAMLRSTLPPGVRDVFRHLHGDYEKYYKYTGKV